MNIYSINSTATGLHLGNYEGVTAQQALDAYARDAGYEDHETMCDMLNDTSEIGAAIEATLLEGESGTATVTAQDFAATIAYPVIRVYAVGDSGRDTALFDDGEPELGFHWEELVGHVDEGQWAIDDPRGLRDAHGNSVLNVWIRDDRDEYERQRDEYEAGY